MRSVIISGLLFAAVHGTAAQPIGVASATGLQKRGRDDINAQGSSSNGNQLPTQWDRPSYYNAAYQRHDGIELAGVTNPPSPQVMVSHQGVAMGYPLYHHSEHGRIPEQDTSAHLVPEQDSSAAYCCRQPPASRSDTSRTRCSCPPNLDPRTKKCLTTAACCCLVCTAVGAAAYGIYAASEACAHAGDCNGENCPTYIGGVGRRGGGGGRKIGLD